MKLIWIRTEFNTLIGPYPTQGVAKAVLNERVAQNKNDSGIVLATPMEALISHNS